jgi:hypothetical protein
MRGPDRPSRYLTDGTHLFRLLADRRRPPHGGLSLVEDCRTLDVRFIDRDELRRLRPVTVASAARTAP